ncbi:response regulator [Rickettsiella endosymbiont of Miltochrista miniata]|uniref:response regulator n=1 Tax=Rickettsiella endosymbiont of Miltochrista miniata TaxID=3066239 RepID=UPI00313B5965
MERKEEQKLAINIIKRVLLMEDDFLCQKIMINYLCKLSYQVDLIDDGIKAIQFIQGTPYDLIIADIRLKGASGWEVIECVRDSESNAGTPLIVWSAFVNKNHEEQYLAWGADAALVKWCSYKLLENTIQQCFLTPRYKRNFFYKFKAFKKKFLENCPIELIKNINYLRQLVVEYQYWSNFHNKSEK